MVVFQRMSPVAQGCGLLSGPASATGPTIATCPIFEKSQTFATGPTEGLTGNICLGFFVGVYIVFGHDPFLFLKLGFS